MKKQFFVSVVLGLLLCGANELNLEGLDQLDQNKETNKQEVQNQEQITMPLLGSDEKQEEHKDQTKKEDLESQQESTQALENKKEDQSNANFVTDPKDLNALQQNLKQDEIKNQDNPQENKQSEKTAQDKASQVPSPQENLNADTSKESSNEKTENVDEDDDESYLYDEDDKKEDTEKQDASKDSDGTNQNTQNQDKKQSGSGGLGNQEKQPKVVLEENAKTGKKADAKEVVFMQEDSYELDADDFNLKKEDDGYIFRVNSIDLESFVNGQTYNDKNQVQTFGVNNNFTQIMSKNGKIQEYKFFQKSSKKNTILNTMRLPLEKIDFDTYRLVVDNLPNYFDATACKVIIKKEISTTLNQNKEVIIDLDIKRELKNTTNFKLFLECPR